MVYSQRCSVVTWLVPRETAAFSARSVYTIQPCTILRLFMHILSHIHREYTRLVVTCHPHFRQNGGDLLRVTAVTRRWNGYRNKSQDRKLTLEKKIIPPLVPGIEPETSRSRVMRFNHWAILAPGVTGGA